MIKSLTLALLLLPSLLFGGQGMGPGPGNKGHAATFTYNYCVRQDGSAVKASATDCSAASTSMSMASFNAATFSAGETVAFTDRGGTFTTALTAPSSGSSGAPIVLIGEPVHTPTISTGAANIVVGKDYITLTRFNTSGGTYGFHVPLGTYTGVTTNDLYLDTPTGEGARHEGVVDITHNNLTILGVDEPLTTHGASGTITVNGGVITGYNSSGAIRGATGTGGNFVINDVVFTAAAGGMVVTSTNGTSGTLTLNRCTVYDSGTTRGIDARTDGILTLTNNVFIGMTTGDYYILPKDGSIIYNNTFVGPGSSMAIFNNAFTSASKIKNNIFTSLTQGLYGTGGDIDYNLFYNAGTTRGTNIVTGDPVLNGSGHITSGSSPAVGVGVNLAAVFPDDIDKQTRSTSAFGLGADYYVP